MNIFYKTNSPSVEPDQVVSEYKYLGVWEYKYLGVWVNSKVPFKALLKRFVTRSNSIFQTSDSFEIRFEQSRLRCRGICIPWSFLKPSTVNYLVEGE